jgi:O-antigen/teichoic acid export membrane protein
VVVLIIVSIAIFELFATPIVSAYLGPAFGGSVTTLRVLMLGALPWGIYISLRSVIDARHKMALNAINVAVAFAVFTVLMLVLQIWVEPATAVVPVFVLSLYVLGTLTAIEVVRIARTGAPALPEDVSAEPVPGNAAEPML